MDIAATAEVGEVGEFSTLQTESEAKEELRLFLRIVDEVTGEELEREFALPLDALDDPIGIFTRRFQFPNGHYRVYLEEIQTRRVRLIIDVHVYEGRVVPPDFRDDASERQPGAEPEVNAPVEPEARIRVEEAEALAAERTDETAESVENAPSTSAGVGVIGVGAICFPLAATRVEKSPFGRAARLRRRLRAAIRRGSATDN